MKKKIVHYQNKVITIDSDVAKKYKELTTKVDKIMKELEPIEEQMKTELKEVMEKVGETNVKSNGIIASLKKAYIQNKFDTNRLKKENILIYNQYLKPTNVSSSLSLKLDN